MGTTAQTLIRSTIIYPVGGNMSDIGKLIRFFFLYLKTLSLPSLDLLVEKSLTSRL